MANCSFNISTLEAILSAATAVYCRLCILSGLRDGIASSFASRDSATEASSGAPGDCICAVIDGYGARWPHFDAGVSLLCMSDAVIATLREPPQGTTASRNASFTVRWTWSGPCTAVSFATVTWVQLAFGSCAADSYAQDWPNNPFCVASGGAFSVVDGNSLAPCLVYSNCLAHGPAVSWNGVMVDGCKYTAQVSAAGDTSSGVATINYGAFVFVPGLFITFYYGYSLVFLIGCTLCCRYDAAYSRGHAQRLA